MHVHVCMLQCVVCMYVCMYVAIHVIHVRSCMVHVCCVHVAIRAYALRIMYVHVRLSTYVRTSYVHKVTCIFYVHVTLSMCDVHGHPLVTHAIHRTHRESLSRGFVHILKLDTTSDIPCLCMSIHINNSILNQKIQGTPRHP